MTTTPLVAGPEMDHAIATRVLGMTYCPRYGGGVMLAGYYITAPHQAHGGICENLPAYSTDLGAAAAVLDWLREQGHVVLASTQDDWYCQCDLGRVFFVENGDTPAEAICRLALAVKEQAG